MIPPVVCTECHGSAVLIETDCLGCRTGTCLCVRSYEVPCDYCAASVTPGHDDWCACDLCEPALVEVA